jgi:hypothetical protein
MRKVSCEVHSKYRLLEGKLQVRLMTEDRKRTCTEMSYDFCEVRTEFSNSINMNLRARRRGLVECLQDWTGKPRFGNVIKIGLLEAARGVCSANVVACVQAMW